MNPDVPYCTAGGLAYALALQGRKGSGTLLVLRQVQVTARHIHVHLTACTSLCVSRVYSVNVAGHELIIRGDARRRCKGRRLQSSFGHALKSL